MAKMVLSDLNFDAQLFRDNVIELAITNSPLFNAGIVTAAPILLPERGNTVHMPYFTDLDGSPEALSDTSSLTVNKVLGKDMVAVVNRMGKAFGANDLVGWTAGSNPLANLETRFANFWRRALEERAVKSLVGCASITSAANVLDLSAQVGAAGHVSPTAVFKALELRGENMYDFDRVVMSPENATKLSIADQIDTQKDSDARQVRMFGGREVIVSKHAGDYVFLTKAGAIGYADGTPAEVILEEERSILAGDNLFTSRMIAAIHPMGYSYAGTYSQMPSTTALATGANWTIAVTDPVNLPFVAIKTNGDNN